jgi:hypothetical protein
MIINITIVLLLIILIITFTQIVVELCKNPHKYFNNK